MIPAVSSDTSSLSPKKKRAKNPVMKKSAPVPESIETLRETRDAGVKKHGKGHKTRSAYDGQVQRGKEFLAALAKRIAENVCENPLDTSGGKTDITMLEAAFDKPPNKYSAEVFQLWLMQKCFTENHPKSADSIVSAFIDYWDQMVGEAYHGPYRLDQSTGQVTGNPACSAVAQDLLQAIKKSTAGTAHNHAEAITIGDIKIMMDYSRKLVPDALIKADVIPPELFAEVAHHSMMCAFITSGFVLWTRNFELCQLQFKHVKENCIGPAPYNKPYTEIKLKGRKGWEAKAGQEQRTGNRYEVYDQPDTPKIDLRPKLTRWMGFYRKHLLCNPPREEDYIFPYINTQGVTRPRETVSANTIQEYIDRFAVSGGLTDKYTTHSFRQGGAQYRFMFAPVGKRWSLAVIRWWGGWSAGEHVDTLIKYLLDELQHYENYHGNALHPIATEADKSFMGDHTLLSSVTVQEVREMTASIHRRLDSVITSMSATSSTLTQLCPSCNHGTHSVSMTTSAEIGLRDAPAPSTGQLAPINPRILTAPHKRNKRSDAQPALRPLTGECIPRLSKGPSAWSEAMKQWNDGDSAAGLLTPLKDWPKTWYSGNQAKFFGQIYGEHARLARAYASCGASDAAFVSRYPEANKGWATLRAALRRDFGESSRNSKNGKPGERDT
ncbi:hypothetical protein C8J56DRAFT_777258 [Mycena floridula]|nr:hypothetical protein C8J56DRAFT_777258 [Mycena floridula]